ncbi:uncharacterized protein DSM5745_05301 [Aspergillus mulundensis]|uniref:Uncharacterized protein n=1 Tax=Aspergillus mulundensis TaxID=1810919 RepID=A0A3D8S6T4_9EURO|nr:Uncharacterized protein DSM5745_05301 [Aspergillus mulundensis]RDW81744.1 Uncharacterized protein DSM5745_05301 [Aspergillus mulundensis]
MRLFALLLRVVATLPLSLGTTAQQCSSREDYTARTQAEIDKITQNCTTIAGELGLVDWSGPLTLPNITRINSITLYSGNITSIELPALEYLGSNLLLTDLPSLRRVYLPRLEYIEGLYVDFASDAPELHLPKLTNTSSIYLRGNFSDQSFDSLRRVEKKFDICNAVSCGYYSRMEAYTPMSLSFPVLESVGSFIVAGNVSSLSLPELSTLTCRECDWAALQLKLYGSSRIPVDLPKLSSVNGSLNIRGDIDSISLPSLQEYTRELIITPYEPLNITLPVEKAEDFLFTGNITSIQLPNIKDFTRIHIDSDLDFDCDELWEDLDRTSGPLNESCKEEYFQCSVGVSCYAGRLQTVAVALGLVLGMGFLT